MSLISELKKANLRTNIGEFEFVRQIGQGGNALVCEFKKDTVKLAIKFLEHTDKNKINRFIDEYFCATQAGTHKNIAPSYHLDVVTIENKKYSIIIMKLFDSNLKSQGSIHQLDDIEKSKKGWHLAKCILSGMQHLHSNKIVHRDIKPENILHSDTDNNYVIADLGIAHFSSDYPKEALTRSGERLSNYHCSPMDQIDGRSDPNPTWDLFAFGQVMNWYLFNGYIRGDGKEIYNGDNFELKTLDRIIEKCVQNNPSNRFSSVDDIKDFYDKQINTQRDIWERFDDFDLAVRSSLPAMKTFYETSNKIEINRFLTSFSEKCHLDEFWYITDEAGDNSLNNFKEIDNDRWLLGRDYELKIEKLLVYRNDSLHKSLFILFTEKDSPFDHFDCNGLKIEREVNKEWEIDAADLYDSIYHAPNHFDSGFYEKDGEVYPINRDLLTQRIRYLRPASFMIVPTRTGPSFCSRKYNEEILKKATKNRTITKSELLDYIEIANEEVAFEISIYL